MAQDCTKSILYDGGAEWSEGDTRPIVSLCDRVPAGKYAVVRTGQRSLAETAGFAKGLGLRGLVWHLGSTDTDLLATGVHRQEGIYWSPDHGGRDWQRLQAQLQDDQLDIFNMPPKTVAGPKTLRDLRLVSGAIFTLGHHARRNPATVAAACASIRNRLGLDFVMLDISDPAVWNMPGAAQAALVLAVHIQERFQGLRRGKGGFPSLSHHCPVFMVLPPRFHDVPNLVDSFDLASPGAFDNLFPPFSNWYAGPKTFGAVRMDPSMSPGALVDAWQWSKATPATTNANVEAPFAHIELVVDIRGGGDPSGLVNAAAAEGGTAFTVLGVPYSEWPSASEGVLTPRCGLVVYDDLDAALGGVGVPGTDPTTYWDFDGMVAQHEYVPVLDPDPFPLAIVDREMNSGLPDNFSSVETGLAPDASVLSAGQVHFLAEQAFGDLGHDVVDQMVGIARAESGYSVGAISATNDYGLWQINAIHGFDTQQLLSDPFYNATAARRVYDMQGFGAWVTYNVGVAPPVHATSEPFTWDGGGAPAPSVPGTPSTPAASRSDKVSVALTFERWRRGHVDNPPLPGAILIARGSKSDIPWARSVITSWIKVNGHWLVDDGSTPLTPPEAPEITEILWAADWSRGAVISGTPRPGDEGTYALTISLLKGDSGVQFFQHTSVFYIPITVVSPTNNLDPEVTSTEIPSVRPDMLGQGGSFRLPGADSLHPVVPSPVHLGLPSTTFGKHAGLDQGQTPLPALPLPAFVSSAEPVNATACGVQYHAELLDAAADYCDKHGQASNRCTNRPVDYNNQIVAPSFFAAMVFGAAVGLSGYDVNYSQGCKRGLFALDTCGGAGTGFTDDQLRRPQFSATLAMRHLSSAWEHVQSSTSAATPCNNAAYRDKVQHAMIYYLDISGTFPGLHATAQALEDADPSIGTGTCVLGSGDGAADAIAGAAATAAVCMHGTYVGAGAVTPSGTVGGGALGGVPGFFVASCPMSGTLTADCAWHLDVEGIPAVDIGAASGTQQFSVCPGVITFQGWHERTLATCGEGSGGPSVGGTCRGYGIMTKIACDNGYELLYGHGHPDTLTSGSVKHTGDRVEPGDVVALNGTTGNSSGPHLHFEMFQGGVRVCPLPSLPLGCV